MADLVPFTSGYLPPYTTLGNTSYHGDGDNTGYSDAGVDTIIDTIENISDVALETYRGDMISDVNKGLGVVATGIKIISAILTILGGTTNRR